MPYRIIKISLSLYSLIFGLLVFMLILYRINQIFGTPICTLIIHNNASDWQTYQESRYCIMKRIVKDQSLKGLETEQVEHILGDAVMTTKDGTAISYWYPTNISDVLDQYYLVVIFENNLVVKCEEVLH